MALPPEAFIPITQYQQKIIDALDKAGANHPCSACGKNEWGVTPDPSSVPVIDSSGKATQEYLAIASVVCTNCGNTRLHSLKALGFLNWQKDLIKAASQSAPAPEVSVKK